MLLLLVVDAVGLVPLPAALAVLAVVAARREVVGGRAEAGLDGLSAAIKHIRTWLQVNGDYMTYSFRLKTPTFS